MKANEAPDKIILSADRETMELNDKWMVNDYTDNIKIEYTRTDTFVKKAILYLIYNTNVVHYPFGYIREFKNNNFNEMLKDFENHMKV